MTHSLSVYQGEQCVFHSDGNWLHPLFELEAVIKDKTLDPGTLTVHDKIVGAGSAFLIAHLGIRYLHAGILSQRGEAVLQRFGISFTGDTRVERVACATEGLLDPAMPVAEAVAILRQRAGRGGGSIATFL
jgi:zinc transport system ATP-binding protein